MFSLSISLTVQLYNRSRSFSDFECSKMTRLGRMNVSIRAPIGRNDDSDFDTLSCFVCFIK